MRFELFVASRYLLSRRKQTFIFVISLMSILGVAIGVAALILVLGVYNGFTKDIQDKILGANAHILVMAHERTAFEAVSGGTAALIERIEAVDGVKAVTPYIYTEVMISTPAGAKGLLLRGIDEKNSHGLAMLHPLAMGDITKLTQQEGESGPPGIVLGKEVASLMKVDIGSRVNLMSPMGQSSTAGFSPKIKPFKVIGIFSSGMVEYDSALAFISMDAARDFLSLPEGRLSGIEVMMEDPYNADIGATAIINSLGFPFYTRHWKEMNANLFAALELEKFGMFLVLTMIILVGSFSIITSLIMLVMEKTRDIAILMSMGATKRTVRRIFMLQGTIIGLVGTTFGYVLGLSLAWVLKNYDIVKLPAGVYTMDHLPLLINTPDTWLVGVVSMLLCVLATIYPSRKAAALVPAKALRYE